MLRIAALLGAAMALGTFGATLTHQLRAAAPGVTGQLTLFGVDSQGRARYYAPTPVAPSAVRVDEGVWQAAPLSVRLQVNHTPGPLRVFALLSPQAPSVEDVDTWAAALASTPTIDPTPWHRRVGAAPTTTDPDQIDRLRVLCGAELDRCHSARLELNLSPPSNEETP